MKIFSFRVTLRSSSGTKFSETNVLVQCPNQSILQIEYCHEFLPMDFLRLTSIIFMCRREDSYTLQKQKSGNQILQDRF